MSKRDIVGIICSTAAIIGLSWWVITIIHNKKDVEQKYQKLRYFDSLSTTNAEYRTSFLGRPIHAVLGVDSVFARQFLHDQRITSPFIALVVKTISCSSCYQEQTVLIRKALSQNIPVVLCAYSEAEYVQRDFRKKLFLFPPPFVKNFVEEFQYDMGAFLIDKHGMVIQAAIPYFKGDTSFVNFYRFSSVFCFHNKS